MKKHPSSHGMAVLVCSITAGIRIKMCRDYYPEIARRFEDISRYIIIFSIVKMTTFFVILSLTPLDSGMSYAQTAGLNDMHESVADLKTIVIHANKNAYSLCQVVERMHSWGSLGKDQFLFEAKNALEKVDQTFEDSTNLLEYLRQLKSIIQKYKNNGDENSEFFKNTVDLVRQAQKGLRIRTEAAGRILRKNEWLDSVGKVNQKVKNALEDIEEKQAQIRKIETDKHLKGALKIISLACIYAEVQNQQIVLIRSLINVYISAMAQQGAIGGLKIEKTFQDIARKMIENGYVYARISDTLIKLFDATSPNLLSIAQPKTSGTIEAKGVGFCPKGIDNPLEIARAKAILDAKKYFVAYIIGEHVESVERASGQNGYQQSTRTTIEGHIRGCKITNEQFDEKLCKYEVVMKMDERIAKEIAQTAKIFDP